MKLKVVVKKSTEELKIEEDDEDDYSLVSMSDSLTVEDHSPGY